MATIKILTKQIGTNKQISQPANFTPPIDYSAILIIGVQKPTDPLKIINYKFCFWTINNTFQTDPHIKITAQQDITAIAWYTVLGIPSGKNHAFGWAFSLTTGEFLTNEIPFKTVNPPDGWTPTQYIVETTNHSVDITAKDSIQNQGFKEWFSMIPEATAINGSVVTVFAKKTVYLVAKYEAGLLDVHLPEAKVIPIPGEITLGFQAMIWLVSGRILDLIREFRLRPMSDVERKMYSNKEITDFRCAIDSPHLHHNGETYLLNEQQWNLLSNRIQGKLSKELADAKSISFDSALKISKSMELSRQ
ncbi:MAG: hypothetical protein AC479_07035 [miscellaneous Crenarchaeota group-6 archaeon AD8-1]|nr:MAG: hypothetical protein AC479_07035 [miscellaneous Crenarchaeota group-6 archaeon AD8-1]